MLAPVLLAAACFGADPPADRPNVVFILADDLGWADTTLYGHTALYETPNIERLAARGVTFTRAYANSPLCSPTRASILTGQTPARHGSTAPQHHTPAVRMAASVPASSAPNQKAVIPESVTRLDTSYPTLGKLLRASGYRTGHFGKWHLGPEPFGPLRHGFEVDVPHHPGPGPAGSYVAPWKFRDFKANRPGEHIEDRTAAEAAAWIDTLKDEPFFLNYWQFSVHAPFDAKPGLVARYRKKIAAEVAADAAQRSPTYAAMVHALDDAVGTLLDAVEAAGVADRTAFVFVSDNGGNMYSAVDGTVPTGNAPLRGGKATIFEGGVRVPCVVARPGLTEPGSRSDALIQTSDFYPTLLNLLGVPLPAGHPIDGVDLTPVLEGEILERDAIFTYFPHAPPVPDWLPPSVAVHRKNDAGDWKLIRLFHQGAAPAPDEERAHRYKLFDLAADVGETNDLSAERPDLVAELDALIEDYLDRSDAVVPRPNPRFDPAKYRPEQEGVGKIRAKPARRKSAAAG